METIFFFLLSSSFPVFSYNLVHLTFKYCTYEYIYKFSCFYLKQTWSELECSYIAIVSTVDRELRIKFRPLNVKDRVEMGWTFAKWNKWTCAEMGLTCAKMGYYSCVKISSRDNLQQDMKRIFWLNRCY